MKNLLNNVFDCIFCFFTINDNSDVNQSAGAIQSFLFVDYILSETRLEELFSGKMDEEIKQRYSMRCVANLPGRKIFNNLWLLAANNIHRHGSRTGESYILALSGNEDQIKNAIASGELHKFIVGAMEYNNAYHDIVTLRDAHKRLIYHNTGPVVKEDLHSLGFIENPFQPWSQSVNSLNRVRPS